MHKLPAKYAVSDQHETLLTALHRINPDFAEYLQKRYENEREDFEKALLEAVPSTKLKHWAKTSCNKCFGKGIITINGQDTSCRCVDKNYYKWFESFRKDYYKRDKQ